MEILYITHLLNGLLMVAAGVGAGILFTEKFHLSWRYFLIGAATFILSQVAHLPFNQFILNPMLQKFAPGANSTDLSLLVYALAFGLSAGIFESLFRYGTLRWWAKDARTWEKGVLIGAGHGGIEAAILGGLVLLTFFQMSALRGTDLSQIIPSEQLALAQQQVQAYWSLPPLMPLLGALERFLTIPVHLALTVLVMQVFIRGQHRWLLAAIGLHSFLDAAAVFISGKGGVVITEFVLAGFTLFSLFILWRLKRTQPHTIEASEPSEPIQQTWETLESEIPSDFPPAPEDLDKTRYG